MQVSEAGLFRRTSERRCSSVRVLLIAGVVLAVVAVLVGAQVAMPAKPGPLAVSSVVGPVDVGVLTGPGLVSVRMGVEVPTRFQCRVFVTGAGPLIVNSAEIGFGNRSNTRVKRRFCGVAVAYVGPGRAMG